MTQNATPLGQSVTEADSFLIYIYETGTCFERSYKKLVYIAGFDTRRAAERAANDVIRYTWANFSHLILETSVLTYEVEAN